MANVTKNNVNLTIPRKHEFKPAGGVLSDILDSY